MSAHDPLPPTDALQQEAPEPPLAKLHIPDGIPVAPNVALPSNATVWTKLHLLMHAHQLAARAARKVMLLRILVVLFALFASTLAGALIGGATFWLVYNRPREAQHYTGWQDTYYIQGKEVSQHEYDYYLDTHTNETGALVSGILLGLVVAGITFVVLWFLLRPRKPTVFATIDEQITAIGKDHPEAVAAWGGVAVLRIPQLIERLLDMQSKEARR
jgi:O-antigen ligase